MIPDVAGAGRTVGPVAIGPIAFGRQVAPFRPQVVDDGDHSFLLRFFASAQRPIRSAGREVAAGQRQHVEVEEWWRIGEMAVERIDHLAGQSALPELFVVHQGDDGDRFVVLAGLERDGRVEIGRHIGVAGPLAGLPVAPIDRLGADELIKECACLGIVAQAGVDVGQIDVKRRQGIRSVAQAEHEVGKFFPVVPRAERNPIPIGPDAVPVGGAGWSWPIKPLKMGICGTERSNRFDTIATPSATRGRTSLASGVETR